MSATSADFTLREYLGRGWSNECVSFPLSDVQTKAATQGRALLGPGGLETAYQVSGAGSTARISFQADLPPYQTLAYTFAGTAAKPATDLRVTEDATGIQIVNGRIGIELRKRLQPGQGPIARVRLGSGIWTGGSTIEGGTPPAAYEVEMTANGPVFAEAVCRATWADKGTWTLRVRVERAEPVVLVDEQFDAPGGGVFRVVLGDKAFQPTHMLNRDSRAESAAVRADAIGGYYLEPWVHWNNGGHGNWIALYTPTPVTPDTPQPAQDKTVKALTEALTPKTKDPRPDMLAIALLKPSLWLDPKWAGKAPQGGTGVGTAVRDGVMTVDMPVQGGRRVWLLGALDKEASVAVLGQRVAPPPQQLVVKHGDIPLDTVKDWVLDWTGDEDNHPVLFVRKADLPALRSRLVSDPKELERWRSQQPVDKYLLDGPIKEFLATGDSQLGKRMAEKAEEYLQTCVDWYLKEDYLHCPGTAPHMQSLISTVINLVDPVLSTDAFTPERRKRVLAKLAFIGYILERPDYWSPERGYSGFANMTSVVALYRTGVACILPSHPKAKAWAQQGLGQLAWQLTAWSDEDGGWVEAPHYAMVSFDHMLAGFTMAANAGLGDYFYHPRMRKVVEWFAGISTPRDSRSGGFRHQPPIGNTYHGEPNGVYGLIASMWKQKDPAFAAQMQWMFEQSGSIPTLGNGWNFPAMLGYRFQMSQSGVTAKPANFGSALYRNTGAVLRNTMQTDRETYLHIIGGPNNSHYDYDSGSIILYGKGRVLCDDWGYIGKHGGQFHSMLGGGGGIMNLESFGACAAFDQVSGTCGSWTRQIGLVKDPDPLGPTFFLLRDLNGGGADNWRLWMTGAEVRTGDQGATLIGSEDVDMDIIVREAAALKFATDKVTQHSNNGFRNGREVPVDITQIRLQGTLPGGTALSAILYPRLKTEPAPQVTWHADGHIAQVVTKAGTDYVYLGTKPKPAPAAGGLAAMPVGDLVCGSPSHSRGGGSSAPWVIVNASQRVIDAEAPVKLTPGVYAHPDIEDPATIVWQSPVSGVVTVSAMVRRLPADKKSPPPDKNDGVVAEIRYGDKVLKSVAVPSGSEDVTLVAEGIRVAKGELVRLAILPGKCNWFDMTQVDVQVRGAGGQQWNLADTMLKGGTFANDLPAGDPAALWWACAGDGQSLDPHLSGWALVPVRDVSMLNGELYCRHEVYRNLALWTQRGDAVATSDPAKLPMNFVTLHPGPGQFVNLVWRSPVAGTVRADLRVADGDPSATGPDAWRSDGIHYELRKGGETLRKGAIPNGGPDVRFSVEQIAVAPGDLIRLLILPGGSEWWDSTWVDMVVQDATGKRWSIREALLKGEKLGNQIGADPARAVWWVCSGDAPKFDPRDLVPPAMPEFATADGRVGFQGTAGSVQIRGGKATLSLGAAGKVRVGDKVLAADGPASKTE